MGRLKPKFRLKARALKMVVQEARSLGYMVLRKCGLLLFFSLVSFASRGMHSHPKVEPKEYPGWFKSEGKERRRIFLRDERIKAGMAG